MNAFFIAFYILIGLVAGGFLAEQEFTSDHAEEIKYGQEALQQIKQCEMSYTIPRPCEAVITAEAVKQ